MRPPGAGFPRKLLSPGCAEKRERAQGPDGWVQGAGSCIQSWGLRCRPVLPPSDGVGAPWALGAGGEQAPGDSGWEQGPGPGPHASPRFWKEPHPAKLWSRARKARLHLAPGGAGTRPWGRCAGVEPLNQDQPCARRGPPGSQNLARWAPDALGWKPWAVSWQAPPGMT